MQLVERAWSFFISALSFLSLTPNLQDALQKPLRGSNGGIGPTEATQGDPAQKFPIFQPPNAPGDSDLVCQYPSLLGWTFCSTPNDRSCWLRSPDGSYKYDIYKDYESVVPPGITRRYTITAANVNGYTAPDGFKNFGAKFFNNTYPGPWIQACWGDTLEITVINNLRCNGTTVHWHGIRQKGSFNEDGVNAVSQCPIAGLPTPDYHTYRWRVTQYGTSWYHSHYSLQYADGLLGPLTLFGPTSAPYDEAIAPLMMTDWSHQSAFELYQQDLINGPIAMESMLLNGRGNFTACQKGPNPNCTTIPQPHQVNVTRGKRYLLRLINTSVELSFLFSIDMHNVTIVETDFVPVTSYTSTNVLVAIGQRYHVIVEASQPGELNSYWIRQYVGCGNPKFNVSGDDYAAMGILQYNGFDQRRPATQPWQFNKTCVDEPYSVLHPVYPWTVGPQSNPPRLPNNSYFDVQLINPGKPNDGITRWQLAYDPLWLNFSNPTITNLYNRGSWNNYNNVIVQNTSMEEWVYMLLTFRPRIQLGAHPMHLHGHDFALLQQSYTPYVNSSSLSLKLDNPPRRDVALLPSNGFLVIAFKTDNPGAWLMHCHIAWHASSGLAMQVLENQKLAGDLYGPGSPSYGETRRLCDNWERWYGNQSNWRTEQCDFLDPNLQDDSGI